MSSSSSPPLSDFISGFEKLDPKGKNWLVFEQQFTIAVRHKEAWDHFDGSSKKPIAADPDKPTKAEKDAIAGWEKKENTALYLLTLKVAPGTYAKYKRKGTVADVWTGIVAEFSSKSLLARSNMRRDFLNMRYVPGLDLHSELDRLRLAYENLLTFDIEIPDNEYASVVINFLPSELSAFISQISAQMKLQLHLSSQSSGGSATPASPIDPDKPVIDPELMMAIVLEEWDRREAERKPKGRTKETGVAAIAVSTEKPRKPKGRGPRKPVGECWNCGGKGHKEAQCPSPKADDKKGKDAQQKDGARPSTSANTSKPATGSANVAATARISALDAVAGAWSTMPARMFRAPVETDSDAEDELYSAAGDSDYSDLTEKSSADSIPSLHTVSDSSAVSTAETSSADHEGEEDESLPMPERVPLSERLQNVTNWVAHMLGLESEGDDPALLSAAALVPDAATAAANQPVDLYDSGATHHMSPYRDDFTSFREMPAKSMSAANQQQFHATGVGEMIIPVPNPPQDATRIRLMDVLYTPALGFNLVSIGRIDDAGYTATFAAGRCVIVNAEGITVGQVPKTRGLYMVVRDRSHCAANATSAKTEKLTEMEAHRRFGHIAIRAIRELISNGFISGVELVSSPEQELHCEACVRAKSTRKPVPREREGERATEFGEEVHSDVWGPSRIATLGGRRYYVSFTDDKTRFTTLYLLRTKREVFETFCAFEAWLERHHNAQIKFLNTDRGGEYLSEEFRSHLEQRGIESKLSVHDTSQEAGVSERLNRTLMEKVRAMLIASGLPRFLWGEAVMHAVWLKNRTSTKALGGRTPWAAATGAVPDMSGIPEWGSKAWVHDTSDGKVGERAKCGRWVGFDAQSKGHRVYWPEQRSVTVERNVHFTVPDLPPAPLDDAVELEGEESSGENEPATPPPGTVKEPISDSASEADDTDIPDVPPQPADLLPAPVPPSSRPTRIRKPSAKLKAILAGESATQKPPRGVVMPTVPDEAQDERAVEDLFTEEINGVAMAAQMADVEGLDPRSLEEARRRPEWPRWEEAMKEELEALEAHGTWRLEKPPLGANVVSCRWVFHAKKDASGNVYRYRARLVARGFSQVPGVDFFDTYAPVAKTASIRTALAFAARHDFEVHQLDVKSAYLNGEFEEHEAIWMAQPPGAQLTKDKTLALRLLRPLYGLKQSARHWHKKLLRILQEKLRMSQCDVDQAVFFRADGADLIVIVVHVDDLTVVASTIALILEVKTKLREAFEISDEGEIHWILGFAVERDRPNRRLSLSQTAYIESIISRFGLEDAKAVSTPMDPHVTLTTAQSPSTTAEIAAMRHIPYREAVGSLMYASLGTRPDITYAVSILSRFSDNPGRAHWEAVRRVFRYLSGTKHLKLTYGASSLDLVGYTDADGSMHEDRKAISGYAFLIDGGAVSWSSKRQEIISLSTTESEYVALTHASKEALWLRSLIGQIFAPFVDPVPMNSDNQSAIALARDNQYHARTKHIDIRFHFIRWIIEEKKLRLVYCPTEEMVADALTKALPSPKVKHFASALGLL